MCQAKAPAWLCSREDPFLGSELASSHCVLTWWKGQGTSLEPLLGRALISLEGDSDHKVWHLENWESSMNSGSDGRDWSWLGPVLNVFSQNYSLSLSFLVSKTRV